MRHTLLLLIVCGLQFVAFSQNLVNNNSFEQYSLCPDNEAQIERATGWFKTVGDADYFNACSSGPWSVPPNTYSNYQLAATGNAFAGLIVYLNTVGSLEMIHTQLSSPLTIGTKYYVSMKVNLNLNGIGSDNIALDKLGAKFTTGSMPLIDNSSQVFTNTIVTDTMNWTPISGSFIADSAYTTMYLGIFFDQANIDTLKLAPTVPFPFNFDRAYYFIDDVCISTDSLVCDVVNIIKENGVEENAIVIYPNPFSEQATIKISNNQYSIINYQFTIFDVLGREVFKTIINPSGDGHGNQSSIINLQGLPSGIYFYQITDGKKTVARGKLVKQ